MKINRKTLKKLIMEVSVELSPSEVKAAKQKIEDEGGAAGLDKVAKAVNDDEISDDEISDKAVLDALKLADENIVQHADGDIIDKSGITESLSSKKLRRLIMEVLAENPVDVVSSELIKIVENNPHEITYDEVVSHMSELLPHMGRTFSLAYNMLMKDPSILADNRYFDADKLKNVISDSIYYFEEINDSLYESSHINIANLRNSIKEELKRLSYVSKEQGHSYGKEHVSDRFDDNKIDDIIGHTWLTHVRKKDSSLNEVGHVLWHSLNENGHIAVYDVEWSNGRVETDIPARLLEGVSQTEHGGTDEGVDEAHEAHGIKGHKLNSSVNERKYKKRKKSSKKKKKQKKSPKFWYLGGYGMTGIGNDYGDSGGDGGGNGGGE